MNDSRVIMGLSDDARLSVINVSSLTSTFTFLSTGLLVALLRAYGLLQSYRLLRTYGQFPFDNNPFPRRQQDIGHDSIRVDTRRAGVLTDLEPYSIMADPPLTSGSALKCTAWLGHIATRRAS